MPYYNQYQSAQPFQPNYQQSLQQTFPPNVATPNRVQMMIPPRQYPTSSLSQPQPHTAYYPAQQQQQHQQQYYHFGGQPDVQYNQQYLAQQSQQAFAYNQHVEQRYQPPPPPRVIVPPSPNQAIRSNQRHYPQQPVQVKQEPPPESPMPQKQSTPRPRVLKETKPNIAKQSTPKMKPETESMIPPTQYPSLLLNLADEYIEASTKLKKRSNDYYQLVSTALGCMEAALKNFKLPPLREAQLSLKYAQVLHDETNNLDEAEAVLTKSIDLCERMKFIDLKYAMQLLLSKILFRSKPRAAIKDLQDMIQDIGTYRHVAWEYSFRFQAVFFATEASGHSNQHEALQQLERIQHVAKMNSDHAIYAYAAILESLLHLHTQTPDSIPNSQRAMAKARSLQLNPDVEQHVQMPVFMDIIDLLWSLNTVNDDIEQKRTNLKSTIYAKSLDRDWTADELTWIRISPSSLRGMPLQEGGLVHEQNGKYYIALSWMGKKELEAIGFLLMGVSIVQQNYALKGRAERFIEEGYLGYKEDIIDQPSMLGAKDERLKHRAHVLALHFNVEAGFMLCATGQWEKAANILETLRMHLEQVESAAQPELQAIVAYLEGCIIQGTGRLDLALKIFQSRPLALQAKQPSQSPIGRFHTQQSSRMHQDLRVLAAINTALIISSPTHPQHQRLQSLLDAIATHITSTSTTLISAAHSLLISTTPKTPILQVKQTLNAALNSAKQIGNNQIISLTLTFMQDKFFRGGVQDMQAVKCAKAAAHQVRSRWGSPLWMAVSGMLEVESLMLQQDPSKQEELGRKKSDVQKAWAAVPENVKQVLG